MLAPAPSRPPDNSRESPKWSLFEPTFEEAERCLDLFRQQMLANFPFVLLDDSSITAQQLRQERPILFLAIMSVTWKSRSQRQSLGLEMKQVVIQQITSDKRVDISHLLSILIFIIWLVLTDLLYATHAL
jgi:hypothetical protein